MVGDDLKERILKIVGHELNWPDTDKDAMLLDPQRWRSASLMDILFAVEDEFSIQFTSEQMESIFDFPSLLSTTSILLIAAP